MILIGLLSLPVGPDFRSIRIGFRAKISQNDQVLDIAGIFKDDARLCCRFGAENLVFRQFGKSDEFWTIEREMIDPSAALDNRQTVSPIVANGAFRARFHG